MAFPPLTQACLSGRSPTTRFTKPSAAVRTYALSSTRYILLIQSPPPLQAPSPPTAALRAVAASLQAPAPTTLVHVPEPWLPCPPDLAPLPLSATASARPVAGQWVLHSDAWCVFSGLASLPSYIELHGLHGGLAGHREGACCSLISLEKLGVSVPPSPGVPGARLQLRPQLRQMTPSSPNPQPGVHCPGKS